MRASLGYFFLAVGVAFDLLGCVGLIRMPDLYNRLQAATKCVTLGTLSILVSVMILCSPATGAKAFLCGAFVLVSSPTAAHALARGAHRSGLRLWEKSVCDRLAEEKKG